jgi:hypothetical protein
VVTREASRDMGVAHITRVSVLDATTGVRRILFANWTVSGWAVCCRVCGARSGLRHRGDAAGRAGIDRHISPFRFDPRSVLGTLGSSTGPSLPQAVMTRAMAMSGAAMVRSERVRWAVVLVICFPP